MKKKLSEICRYSERQLEARKYLGKKVVRKHKLTKQELLELSEKGITDESGYIIFYGGARGGGKLSPYDSTVCTPFGFRAMGELAVGDCLLNPNGEKQYVIQIHEQGVVDIYRVIFSDGASLEVGEEHLWLASKSCSPLATNDADFWDDEYEGDIWTTRQIIDFLDKKEKAPPEANIKKQNLLIPLCAPTRFTKNYRHDLRQIDPYLLGVLIGDGSLTEEHGIKYTGLDPEIASILTKKGYEVYQNKCKKTWVVRDSDKSIRSCLVKLNLLGKYSYNKFIPECYKYGTIEQRIELVKGLMDTDGYVDDRGHCSYTTISEQLAKDFQWVIWSLGGKATITDRIPEYTYKGEKKDGQVAYTVYFNTKMNRDLCGIKRKKNRCRDGFNGGASDLKRRIERVEYVGKKQARCITVSNKNGLYIGDDFVVTHNSHLVLYSCIENCLRYKNFTCCIIRKSAPELYRWFIPELLETVPNSLFKWNEKRQSAHFYKTGARIDFLGLESDADMIKIKGIPYSMICIDEANAYAVYAIERARGSLRNAKCPDFTPTMILTGNPGEKSDLWFKRHFVNPQPEYWTEHDAKWNRDKFVFVPAKVRDNPNGTFVQQTIGELSSLNDVLRRQWLEGDWNTFSGQFFSEWDESIHVIEPRTVPRHWERKVCIDEGRGTRPTVVLWLTQNPDTQEIWVYRELASFSKPTKLVEEIHELMQGQKEPEVVSHWIADTSMFASESASEEWKADCPAMIFLRNGIYLTRANKDRVNGWRIMRQWLDWKALPEGGILRPPMIRIFDTCRHLIDTIPQQRYKGGTTKDDLDTDLQDDAVDALRYGLVSGYTFPETVVDEAEEYRDDFEEEIYDHPNRYPEVPQSGRWYKTNLAAQF